MVKRLYINYLLIEYYLLFFITLGSLLGLLRDYKFSRDETFSRRLILQLSSAMIYLEENLIIHRDIVSIKSYTA